MIKKTNKNEQKNNATKTQKSVKDTEVGTMA